TLVYTPGAFGRAQPMPQLTIPICTHSPSTSMNCGPPLSPGQPAIPPSCFRAQIMLSVKVLYRGYVLHCSFVMIGTVTWLSTSLVAPPSRVLPQPTIVLSTPAATSSSCSELISFAFGADVGCERWSSARSLSRLRYP